MTPKSRRGLGESLEDYVEIILALEHDAGTARVRDIAARVGVSKPSVTGALRVLKAKGLVQYEPYAPATLTPAGRRVAGEVARRHRVLKEFLTEVLALPELEANAAACRMEHILAPAVIDRFCAFAAFIHGCPRRVAKWVDGIGFECPERERAGARAQGRSSARASARPRSSHAGP
jgi:DtxR family transcriptional regulator, Mn-dependent transcriptional regulator